MLIRSIVLRVADGAREFVARVLDHRQILASDQPHFLKLSTAETTAYPSRSAQREPDTNPE
jgi:hypothetical protein